MGSLRQALAGYLTVRRSLGYQLARSEKLLAQFTTYLENAGAETVTTESESQGLAGPVAVLMNMASRLVSGAQPGARPCSVGTSPRPQWSPSPSPARGTSDTVSPDLHVR